MLRFRYIHVLAAFTLTATGTMPALAIVGGGNAPAENISRALVVIVGSRGNYCTGAVIARDIVLTAAHCVPDGADYKIALYRSGAAPELINAQRVARHPQFSPQAYANHRATADVALIKTTSPLAGRASASLGVPIAPIANGARFTIAGAGVTSPGQPPNGSTRAISLVATGKPGTLQIRLVDPLTQGARAGLGACTGDSGAPAFETQNGRDVIVGIVSWTTGPNLSAGCGGLTGITPLTLYRGWLVQTARQMGAPLAP